MTSGQVQGAWSGVRSSMVSVLFSDTETCCFENCNDDGHPLGKAFHRLRHKSCIIGVQHASNCPPYTCQLVRAYPRRVLLKVLLEVNQIPHNVWVLTEAYCHGVCHIGEEDIEKKR